MTYSAMSLPEVYEYPLFLSLLFSLLLESNTYFVSISMNFVCYAAFLNKLFLLGKKYFASTSGENEKVKCQKVVQN